jgi:hypothetical protein
MLRYAVPIILAGTLLLGGYSTKVGAMSGQAQVWDDLSGQYVNQSNGGPCSISRDGRSYVFVNENGTPAQFDFVSRNRLRMISGDWDPRTVATVQGRDRWGRMVIRFDSTGQPGFWVQTD